jgi:hypothetical protein
MANVSPTAHGAVRWFQSFSYSVAILPDVTVAPTLADVRASRDPVLREAQAVLAQRLGN